LPSKDFRREMRDASASKEVPKGTEGGVRTPMRVRLGQGHATRANTTWF
jgi:hypothetical protein